MTRRDPRGDDRDRRDDHDGRGDDGDHPRGIIWSLIELLREMDERDERSRTGRSRPGGHTSVDYSISVTDLSSSDDDDPFETWWTRRDADEAGTDSPSDDGQAADAHVTTRETDGGLVVVADLPGVGVESADAWLDEDADALVIDVGGGRSTRLPLESDGWSIVDSHLSNGILEVELRRS